jgi:hypothetical protein
MQVSRKDGVINGFNKIRGEISGVWGFGDLKTAALK